MNKINLEKATILLQYSLNDASNSIIYQWYSMTLDIIDSRILKSSVIKAKRKVPKNICMIHFLNKFAEFINVSRNSAISFKIRKFIVAYQLNNSISFKIFNFNKFIHNLDVKVFFQDNFIMACGCEDSNF